MKLTEIKTELFTRTTITDYGVKVESFDKTMWIKSGMPEMYKYLYIISIHILKSGGINIDLSQNKHLSIQQLDEIHRISEILRSEK